MSLKLKKSAKWGLPGLILTSFVILAFATPDLKEVPKSTPPDIDEANKKCLVCHEKSGNGRVIVNQWKESRHAKNGVGCLECHSAKEGEPDAFKHNGSLIATIVTPKDCANCHADETEQFAKSHHADGGMILGSLDNVLAEVVAGHKDFRGGTNPGAANGCWQCHGSKVEILKDEKGNTVYDKNGILQFDPKTWPNTGIGRVNLDGSKGSCSACHTRHSFSVAQVRQPENCGKCHLGPDHPQLEIYNESKHGINFRANVDKMNLDAKPWIAGQDYNAAPTCATCHMSATPTQKITHDVGDRISWTLRPKVSEKIDAAQQKKFKNLGVEPPEGFLNWEDRRSNMKEVCSQCHVSQFVNNFYSQYDSEVHLYNDKYGIPATEIIKELKAQKLLNTVAFDEKIEWTYFYLWHHEGRRARMGAAMSAPDYTHWHGNFDLAERFYMEFIPEVKEVIENAKAEGKTTEAEVIEKLVDETLESEMHKWFLGKVDPEEARKRKEAAKAFRERYSND